MTAAADNKREEDAYHWIYVEFASSRARWKNMDARHDFFSCYIRRQQLFSRNHINKFIMLALCILQFIDYEI